MSDTPESTANSAADQDGRRKILVWDAPVRIVHWLLVASFAGAYLSGESDRWQAWHFALGYTMAGLVAFRLVWGCIGTRHARFTDFVRGPRTIMVYVGALMRGHPQHHTGHNPAGAVAIILLLLLTLLVAATGWGAHQGVGGELLEEVHETTASVMLALVGMHVAGVLISSWVHRENLIGAMISGHKLGKPADGVRSSWRSVAALVLTVVLGYWWLQWHGAAPGPRIDESATAADKANDDDD